MLSAVEGAGDVRAMVAEEGGSVTGVVIVAAGAEDMGVRLSLMQAARALLDVELEQIEVIPDAEGCICAGRLWWMACIFCVARGGGGPALFAIARAA